MTGKSVSATCDRFRDAASDYLDEKLEKTQREPFDRHLAACSFCAQLLTELTETKALLSQLEASDAEPALGRSADLLADFYPGPDLDEPTEDWTLARELWSKLLQLRSEERSVVVDRDPRFQRRLLVRWLAVHSRRLSPHDPARALEAGSLAALLARRIWEGGETKGNADTACLAFLDLSYVLQQNERLQEAERCVAEAEVFTRKGSGDPMLRCAILRQEALLAFDLGRFESAVGLSRAVVEVSREHAGKRELSVDLINLAQALAGVDAVEEAADCALASWKELIESGEGSVRLEFLISTNVFVLLIEADRQEAARETLLRMRALGPRVPGWKWRLNLRASEATMAHLDGDSGRAEVLYRENLREAIGKRLPIWISECCLDFARLLAEQERWDELKMIVSETVGVLTGLEAPAAVQKAMQLFRRRVEEQTWTASQRREVLRLARLQEGKRQ